MKAKKELAKRIIATFQLKTLVRFLKVQSLVGLTNEEKNRFLLWFPSKSSNINQ